MLALNSSDCKAHHGEIVDLVGRAVPTDSSYLQNPNEAIVGLSDSTTEPTYSTRLKLEKKHLGPEAMEYKFEEDHIVLLLNVKCYCPASYTTFYLTAASCVVVKHLHSGKTEVLKNGGVHTVQDFEALFGNAQFVPKPKSGTPHKTETRTLADPVSKSSPYDTMQEIIASHRKALDKGMVTPSKCMLVEIVRLIGDVRQKGFKVEASDYSSCALERVRYNPPYRFRIVFWDQASQEMLRLWERNDHDTLLLHIPSITIKRYRDEFEATVKAVGNEDMRSVDPGESIASEFRQRKRRLRDGILYDEDSDELDEPEDMPSSSKKRKVPAVVEFGVPVTPKSSPLTKIPRFIIVDKPDDQHRDTAHDTLTIEIGPEVRCYFRGGTNDIPFCTLENLDKQTVAYTVGQVSMITPAISQLWTMGEDTYFRITLCCGKTVKFIHFRGEAALVFLDSTKELNVVHARKKLESLIDRWIDLCVIKRTVNGHSAFHGFGTKIRG